jgi:hypothetical protein
MNPPRHARKCSEKDQEEDQTADIYPVLIGTLRFQDHEGISELSLAQTFWRLFGNAEGSQCPLSALRKQVLPFQPFSSSFLAVLGENVFKPKLLMKLCYEAAR